MRKGYILMGLLLVLTVVMTSNAYAADGWTDFWHGVGGFFYNAMPWNWGNWMGK